MVHLALGLSPIMVAKLKAMGVKLALSELDYFPEDGKTIEQERTETENDNG
jgi:hypothetical protein